MRTTLDIDDDVLLAAREIAGQQGVSMGTVLSELARQALTRQGGGGTRNGVPLFARRSGSSVVSMELVNRLRDDAL